MIFNFNKFVIDVDIDKTKKFYDKSNVITDNCNCDNCCNYLLAIEDFPKEVIDFFKKLNVDIKKATEIYGHTRGKKELYYGGFYHICGKLLKGKNKNHIINKDGFTILDDDDFYLITDNYLVWFEYEVDLPENELLHPAFQMEICFSKVPWKLN